MYKSLALFSILLNTTSCFVSKLHYRSMLIVEISSSHKAPDFHPNAGLGCRSLNHCAFTSSCCSFEGGRARKSGPVGGARHNPTADSPARADRPVHGTRPLQSDIDATCIGEASADRMHRIIWSVSICLTVSTPVHGLVPPSFPPRRHSHRAFISTSRRHIIPKQRIWNLSHRHRARHLQSIPIDDSYGGLIDKVIRAAEQKLPWEVAAERQSRPVLDLSGGSIGEDDLSLSEAASVGSAGSDEGVGSPNDESARLDKEPCDAWTGGNRWLETKLALVELSVLSDDETRSEVFLSKCPQLARLPTEDIVASAQEAIGSIGLSPSAIERNPMLPSYPSHLYAGALEFLSNMMMLPQPTITGLCKTNPDLLIGGLDGYIQEQSVKDALGSAGDALYGVSRSVANDVGKTMRDGRAGPKGF